MSGVLELERLLVRLVGDGSSYTKMLNNAVSQSESAAKTIGAQMTKIGHSMKSTGYWVTAGLTLPIVGVGTAALKMAADAETARVQFETMLGQDKGRAMLSTLQEFAKVTPFQFPQVRDAAKTLLAFGFTEDELMDKMKMLGDVSAATGKDFRELAVIFGQMKGMGRLQGQDFLQLVNAGFPVQEIAKTMGVSMSGLKKAMEEGDVSYQVVEDTFRRLTSEGGKFSNMMEIMSKTAAGQFSNMMDSITLLGQRIGGILMPYANKLIAWVQQAVQWFSELNPGMQENIMIIAGLAAAIGPLLIVFGTLISSIGAVVGFLGAIGLGGGVAVITFTALAAAVGATALVVNDLTKNAYGAQDALESMGAAAEAYPIGIGDRFKILGLEIERVFLTISGTIQDAMWASVEGATKALKWFADGPAGDALYALTGKEISLPMKGALEDIQKMRKESQALSSGMIAGVDSEIGGLLIGDGLGKKKGVPKDLSVPDVKDLGVPDADLGASVPGLGEKELEALTAEAEAITKQARTPSEIFGEETAKLDQLLSQGLISIETYNRAYSDATKEMNDSANRLYEESPLGKLSAESKQAMDAMKTDADSLTKELMTPMEKMQGEMNKLDMLKRAGLISEETYQRGLADIQKNAMSSLGEKGGLEAKEPQQTDFRQVATNRISIAGMTGFTAAKKQEVEARGVETRLDKLINIQQRQQGFALGY